MKILTGHPHLSAIGPVESTDDVQQGRFARAGRAGDSQKFVRGNVEVKAPQSGHLQAVGSVGSGHVFEFDRPVAHGCSYMVRSAPGSSVRAAFQAG